MDRAAVEFMRSRWRNCPTTFDYEVFGSCEFDDWEIEADMAHAEGKDLAIASGRGIGKTHYLARKIWRHQICFPEAISYISGPKIDTIKDGVMPALHFWHERIQIPELKDAFDFGKRDVINRYNPSLNQVMLRTTAANKPDGLKGPRSKNMLVAGDEYSDILDPIHSRLKGFLTTTGYTRFIAISQPTNLSGPFYRMFHTRGDGYYTMNVPSTASRHVSKKFINSIAREFGKDSDEYRIDVLGQFPLASSAVLISMDEIKASMARERKEEIHRAVWGYDHAEGGGDKCALAKRQGALQLAPVQSWREPDPEKSCQRIADEYHDTPKDMRPARICVDATVLGADLKRMLKRKKVPCVHSIWMGKGSKNHRYRNVATEVAFLARDWIREDGCILDDAPLIDQIVKQTFMRTASEKLGLPDKMDDFDNRSPDEWDAFKLTFAREDMGVVEDAGG